MGCQSYCSFYNFMLAQLKGEGPLLKVFSEDGQLVCVQEAMPFRRVHGIIPGINLYTSW